MVRDGLKNDAPVDRAMQKMTSLDLSHLPAVICSSQFEKQYPLTLTTILSDEKNLRCPYHMVYTLQASTNPKP